MKKKNVSPADEIRALLKGVRPEVIEKATCRPTREGMFKAVLKASFVRIHEYVEFVHTNMSDTGPGRSLAQPPYANAAKT